MNFFHSSIEDSFNSMYHGYFMDHYDGTIERRPVELKEERRSNIVSFIKRKFPTRLSS